MPKGVQYGSTSYQTYALRLDVLISGYVAVANGRQ